MNKDSMVCDIATGVCGPVEDNGLEVIDFNHVQKKITLFYVTDPICSHCWALEPVLRKFKALYGQYFNFQTVMGGLLPSWDGFADKANGIGKASDVAGHWREVGEHTRMPIDGSLWLDNPIHSSYPASRLFKVIQQDSEDLAELYLRRAREAVFPFNRNIADDQVLIDIVNDIGLDGEVLVQKASLKSGQQLLEQDFELARSMGVRGFPTIIMVNEENKGVKIVGQRPLDYYVKALEQILEANESLEPQAVPALSELLNDGELLFSREIEDLYEIGQQDVKSYVQAQLPSDQYKAAEVLGEVYFVKR